MSETLTTSPAPRDQAALTAYYRDELRAFPRRAAAAGEPPRVELVRALVQSLKRRYPTVRDHATRGDLVTRLLRRNGYRIKQRRGLIGPGALMGYAFGLFDSVAILLSGRVSRQVGPLILLHEWGHGLLHVSDPRETERWYAIGLSMFDRWEHPLFQRNEAEADLFAALMADITHDEYATRVGAEMARLELLGDRRQSA